MTREDAIKLMRGAACSKTEPSILCVGFSQAWALKIVRHYVKAMAKGEVLGGMVEERVRMVTAHKRKH